MIENFKFTLIDPNDPEWLFSGPIFERARYMGYMIGRSVFRYGGEKYLSDAMIAPELVEDTAIDLEAYFLARAERFIKELPESPEKG
jgi:hypothetical protein